MAFLEIRVPTAVAAVLIILGLPASGAFLLFGVDTLIHPESGADIVPALVICGMGVFLLLMAIAAVRGILRKNKSSNGEQSSRQDT
jgi:hypothetical protein